MGVLFTEHCSSWLLFTVTIQGIVHRVLFTVTVHRPKKKKKKDLKKTALMDVSKFSKVYPKSWIFAINKYFSLQNTHVDQWLKIVGFNLEGAAAEWFQWMTKNGLITTWTRFEESVRNCFGPSEYEDPNGALSKLLQLGTVKDYQREFEKLMNRATDIPDSLLISFYISGLKLHLQREFLVSRPTTLGDAFSLSLITEARLDDQAALVAGTMTKTFGNNGGDESESSGPVTPTENEDAIESGDTSILNSLFGHGRPRSLQLLGTVGTGKVHILIDNGSTHNFVQPGVVERMKLPVKNTKLFKVYIGNVETLLCKNLCAQVTLETYCVKTYLFLERLNAKYIKNKKIKAEFQRRLWDPGINISSKQHLEGKVSRSFGLPPTPVHLFERWCDGGLGFLGLLLLLLIDYKRTIVYGRIKTFLWPKGRFKEIFLTRCFQLQCVGSVYTEVLDLSRLSLFSLPERLKADNTFQQRIIQQYPFNLYLYEVISDIDVLGTRMLDWIAQDGYGDCVHFSFRGTVRNVVLTSIDDLLSNDVLKDVVDRMSISRQLHAEDFEITRVVPLSNSSNIGLNSKSISFDVVTVSAA
ncbi:ty3-gypsy retrotransposon protein [Tanacetum coccineum]